jgi:hypothetical protein
MKFLHTLFFLAIVVLQLSAKVRAQDEALDEFSPDADIIEAAQEDMTPDS